MKQVRKKIGIITSKGGHLYEIMQLQKLIRKFPHFWVTFKGKDSEYYLKREKKYYAFFPESRNALNLIRNAFLAIIVHFREQPRVLISAGAGIAIPFLLIGKYLFKCRIIYIEPYDFIAYPSLTGKILYKFCDLFLVQHKVQLKWYKKAKYWGSLL